MCDEHRRDFHGYEFSRELGKLMVKVYLDTGAVRVTWAMRMHPEHAKDRLTGLDGMVGR